MFYPKKFFTTVQEVQIVAAIKEAERCTSSEVRVHVHRQPNGDVMSAAIEAFHLLEMDKTLLKNGVLFFIMPEIKQFAILGDKGINEKVPQGFWNEIRDSLRDYFRQGQLAEGLVENILHVGTKLQQYFPFPPNDTNELSDEITYS
jgi:uncharacterized membrane protein